MKSVTGELIMDKTKNPIAEQSKQWITQSLLILLEKKRIEEITISEISKKAQLSRRTFYRNFNSKTDVIITYCEHICDEYIKFLDKDIQYTRNHIIEVYFIFWGQHIDFLRLLSNNELLCHLIEVSNRYWGEIYSRFKTHWNDESSDIELEYCLLFNMGGLWNILIKWIYDEHRNKPKDLEKLIQHSLNNFIKSI